MVYKQAMTDNSATKKCGPSLLNFCHFLQRRWTWLWKGKNKIQHGDRTILIGLIKKNGLCCTVKIFLYKEIIPTTILKPPLVYLELIFEFALELYYRCELLNVAHNRVDCFISVKYRGVNAPRNTLSNQVETKTILLSKAVEIQTMSLPCGQIGACSCKRGKDGSPCSHQAADVFHYHHKSLN